MVVRWLIFCVVFGGFGEFGFGTFIGCVLFCCEFDCGCVWMFWWCFAMGRRVLCLDLLIVVCCL